MVDQRAEDCICVRRADVTAVVLAAGRGLRLTGGQSPKCLTTVGCAPIIGHQLMAFESAGCADCLIVVGHLGAEVEAAATAITPPGVTLKIVTNPLFASTGTAVSALIGLLATEIDTGVLLVEGDVVFGSDLIRRILTSGSQPRIAGSRWSERCSGSSIACDHGTVVAVEMEGRQVNRQYKAVNVAYFPAGRWRAVLQQRLESTIEQHGVRTSLELVLDHLARQAPGALELCDVSDLTWWEIDTASDLAIAEELLSPLSATSRTG